MKFVLAVFLAGFFTVTAHASADTAAHAREVRTMTFNIRNGRAQDGDNHWNKRKRLVCDVIRAGAPDIIGVQEAFRFQLDVLKTELPAYGEVGVGRDGGIKGEYSAILYRKMRFDVKESGTFWLSDTPAKPSTSWGNSNLRVCTWALLVDKKTARTFHVYNTHMDHQSQKARENSAELIMSRISQRTPQTPFILMGDFNAAEDSKVIKFLKGSTPLSVANPVPLEDSFRQRHPGEKTVGTFSRFNGYADGAKIDYIFVAPGTTTLEAQIVRTNLKGRYPSDHYPVTAVLRFEKEKPPTVASEDLNGAKGKIFRANVEQRQFELLKETVFDPQTNEGRSRHTVSWTKETSFAQVQKQGNFAGVKGPVVVEFYNLDAKTIAAIAAKQPFYSRYADVLPGAREPNGLSEDGKRFSFWFTPDPTSKSQRSGIAIVNGRQVNAGVRGTTTVHVKRRANEQDLRHGMWDTTIFGQYHGDRFTLERVELRPLVDPRTTDDPALPRVLVIGDSISMNYHESAKSALKDVANYHRNEGNGGPSDRGVASIELWLGDYKEKGLHWDVIQFNHGLHDLKQAYDKGTNSWGEHQVALADYKRNLEREIQLLKQTGATLIWCATTPVPNNSSGPYARRKGEAAVFNKAALEVMQQHPEIQINDLHAAVTKSAALDKWRTGVDVHFWRKDEQAIVGQAVANAIKKALAR